MFKTIGHDVDFRVDLTVDDIQFTSAESLEATGMMKGQSSKWKIWKVKSGDEQDKNEIELYAVAGPSNDL